MKICKKCRLPKDEGCFGWYDHKSKRRLVCKDCVSDRRKQLISENPEIHKERTKQKNSRPESRAARKKYDQEHPEVRAKIRLTFNKVNPGKTAAYFSKYAAQNPEKRKAKQAVNNAVYRGKLLRQPCRDCGCLKAEGHHEDYSKPLEVVWLCRKHHKIADALRREREKANG